MYLNLFVCKKGGHYSFRVIYACLLHLQFDSANYSVVNETFVILQLAKLKKNRETHFFLFKSSFCFNHMHTYL